MESTVITYLSEFLIGFRKKNPRVTIQVESGTTDSILQEVLNHKLNGAFVCGPVKHPDLLTKHVRTEKLCLIASNNLCPDINIQTALLQPLLVFPHGCSYRRILENWMKEEGLTAHRIYEFNTLNSIFASVIAGLGIALFPASCIEQYSQRDALTILSVPDKYAFAPTVFIYRKDSFLSSSMQSFINSI